MHAAARWLGGLPLSRGLGSALVLLSWPDGSSRWQGVEGGLAHMEAGLSHLEQGFETGYGSIESGIAEHVCLHLLIHACTARIDARACSSAWCAFSHMRACAPAHIRARASAWAGGGLSRQLSAASALCRVRRWSAGACN